MEGEYQRMQLSKLDDIIPKPPGFEKLSEFSSPEKMERSDFIRKLCDNYNKS